MVALLIAFVAVAGWVVADAIQRRAHDVRARNTLRGIARAVERVQKADRVTARSLR